MNILILSFALNIGIFAVPTAGICGYASCPALDPNVLNVHIIPHSHDDVGWLKTVDQYYFGVRNDIQKVGIQYILPSIIDALHRNPERRFIQVETAYFWKWWKDQTSTKRAEFKALVDNGQIEMVGGGWSMNDEAATNYQSIIDQFTWGLGVLNDTLGECGRPRIGWQIDPFGHSNEMASIFRYLGFDAFFVARLDYRDKETRLLTQTADMIWEASANRGKDSQIYTHILYNNYAAPPGFCFDMLCQDAPINDDIDSPDYNYEERVNTFASYLRSQAENYQTNNLIVTMGEDFQYQDALYNFINLDRLIKGFQLFPQVDNKGRLMNLLYSTPSCFVKGVNDYLNTNSIALPVKTDDFFPYASDPHSYWTGYFTSRPTSKRFERQAKNLLQASKQLIVAAKENASIYEDSIRGLREALGVMQHHDAITGTEKQHVAQDYARLVTKAIDDSQVHINSIISNLLDSNSTDGIDEDLHLTTCLLTNVSFCDAAQKEVFSVVVYNPLSRIVSQYVRIPVNSVNFTIVGPLMEIQPYQVVPIIADFSYVENIVPTQFELVFLARDIPPLGMIKFVVTNNAFGQVAPPIESVTGPDMYTLGDNITGATLDPVTGKLISVNLNTLTNVPIGQDFLYYLGFAGNNSGNVNRASGAYIFRPLNQDAVQFGVNAVITVYKGPLLDVVHQVFNSWVKQVIRVYREETYIEFDWLVGPIDIDDGDGKEIITRFSTNLNTAEFLTDSNAREMVARVPNKRLTYNFTNEEPTSSNYYPINSRIVLSDSAQGIEVAVINERPQGGTSLDLKQIEFMVHRRLLYDDKFGVGEALNETEFGNGLIVRGQHFLTVAPITSAKFIQKEIAQRKLMEPWVFVGDATTSINARLPNKWSGLVNELPIGLQILNLEPWKEANSVIIRLENIYEVSEIPNNITVNLNGLFTLFDVVFIQETTLGANQLIQDNVRLNWIAGGPLMDYKSDGIRFEKLRREELILDVDNMPVEYADFFITLNPMEIRTFIATIQYK